jgi:hypothetical protein
MKEYARIKEKPQFVKDLDNFALLNTNKSAIAKHKLKMNELNEKRRVETEINTLKSEVSEIKSMLSEILKAVGGEK